MNWPNNPYVLPVLFGTIVSALLAVSTWRRRPAPGAMPAAAVLLAIAVWGLGYVLELVSADLPGKIFWAKFEYFGIVSVPLAWFAFALEYTGHARSWSRRNVLWLGLVPLLTLVLVWTNEQHGLFWSRFELDMELGFVMSNRTRNIGFFINWIFAYALLLPSSILLLRWLVQSKFLSRQQAVVVLIATLAPWIGNLLFVSGLNPFPRLDLTLVAFALSSVALAVGLYRYRLLDIVPIAQDKVIENMADAVLVLDAQNRIVNANPAVHTLLDLDVQSVIGSSAASVFSAYAEFVAQLANVLDTHTEITRGTGSGQRWLDLRISALRIHHPTQLDGRILVLRDITERKRSEQELERLYADLQSELAERKRAQAALQELNDELEQRVAKRTAELSRANINLKAEIDERKRAEAELRASETKYRSLFENSVMGISQTSPDGHLIRANAAYAHMYGYANSEEMLTEETPIELRLYANPIEHKEVLRILDEKGVMEPREIAVVRRDGHPFYVLASAREMRDAHGNLVCYQTEHVDITNRKRMEEALRKSEAQLSNAMKMANLGHWELDVASGMFTFSDNFYAIFRTTAKEMGGYQMSIADYARRFVHPEDSALVEEETREALRTEDPHFNRYLEHRMLYADGRVGHVAVRFFIVKDDKGKTIKTYGVNQEITERRRAAEALQRAHDELETRVAERTQELNARVAQVGTLNQAMANMLQDLRAANRLQQETNQELVRLHEQLREQRIAEQAALLKLSQGLLGETDAQTIMDTAVRETVAALEVEGVSLVLVDDDNEHLSTGSRFGWAPEQSQPFQRLPLAESGAMAQAIRRRRPIVGSGAADQDESSRTPPNADREIGVVANIIVPLTVGDRAIGGLAAYSRTPREWTDDEVRLLSLLGNTIAQALERARLFEQVDAGRKRFEDLSHRLVEVQESERRYIARELHDEIGQMLTGLKLLLAMDADMTTPRALPNIELARSLVGDLMGKVRDLSLNLRPAMLDDLGLLPALLWFIGRYETQTQVRVLFVHLGIEGARFARELEVTAYRIVQEALTNVARHSGAPEVSVRVWTRAGVFEIHVEDNGCGFDPAVLAAGRSGGLPGMRERAVLIGGQLRLDSAPGTGTRVFAELPLRDRLERRSNDRFDSIGG